MNIIVTGGAGFIGSHILVELLKKTNDILVLDNFSNSSPNVFKKIREISNCDVNFETVDLICFDRLKQIFFDFGPDLIIHLAGLKSVNESNEKPLLYYENNVLGSINLLKAMDAVQCKNIIFSSSATVYGDPQYLPLDEKHPCKPTNTYGITKFMVEKIIKDWCKNNNQKKSVILRYFNPIGAHASGLIGEDPFETPNNLMPYITQVALGRLEKLKIYGNDYKTNDGTGVRDYIHVVDLARGHLAAINFLEKCIGVEIFNLGTGFGYSVKEVLNSFEKMSGISIKHEVSPRRSGDVAINYTDISKSKNMLKWKCSLNLNDMTKDSWNWQSKNPDGYK